MKFDAGYRLTALVGKHGKNRVWEEITRLMDELGMEKWGMTRMHEDFNRLACEMLINQLEELLDDSSNSNYFNSRT